MSLKKPKIVLIGRIPPPVGGVTIHISRLLNLLNIQRSGCLIELLDPRICYEKWKRLGAICLFCSTLKANGDIYHLHKPDKSIALWFFLSFLVILRKKVIFTLHNENIADEISQSNISLFKRLSLKLILKQFSHIICVNQRMADALISEGLDPSKISVIPAFIPQDSLDYSSIPNNVRTFVEGHSPVLVGYVFRIYKYKNNERYGGDMMLELIHRLRSTYPSIGLVIVLPNESENNRNGLKNYRQFIKDHNLEDHVIICDKLIDLTALFSISDIHIRPSNTDGDPVAVRESLHIGMPTVASDCTYKPTGTIFHKDRDHDDFEKQVRYVIENFEAEKGKLSVIDKNDYGMSVIDIYDKLLTGSYKEND